MRMHYCLTDEDWSSLRQFRDQNGRYWKRRLIEAWNADLDLGPYLRRVRNIIGPSGLYSVNLDLPVQGCQKSPRNEP